MRSMQFSLIKENMNKNVYKNRYYRGILKKKICIYDDSLFEKSNIEIAQVYFFSSNFEYSYKNI